MELALGRTRRLENLLYILPLAFLGFFFFYPLATVIWESFAPQGRVDLSPLASLWREPYFREALWFTIWQAAVSTLLTLVVGLPAAYVFARYRFPGKSLLLALTTIPFVMPAMVVATAFTALLGPRGWLNTRLMVGLGMAAPPIRLQQTIWIILLVHVFYNTTVVVRVVGGFWSNLDPGSPKRRACWGLACASFREITLPLLLPAIVSAALLVFLFCFTSFGVILILGGPRFATLEVEIYRQAVTLFRLPQAAAICLAQMGITFAFMVLYTRVQARAAVSLNLRSQKETEFPPKGPAQVALVTVTVVGLVLFLVMPLLALAARSLAPGEPLRFYRELFVNRTNSIFYVPPVEAIRNSLVFALITVLLALFIGTVTAYLLARRRACWRAHWIRSSCCRSARPR